VPVSVIVLLDVYVEFWPVVDTSSVELVFVSDSSVFESSVVVVVLASESLVVDPRVDVSLVASSVVVSSPLLLLVVVVPGTSVLVVVDNVDVVVGIHLDAFSTNFILVTEVGLIARFS